MQNTSRDLARLKVKVVCTIILFVCFGIFVQLENVSLKWRHHQYQWRVTHFDLCTALMAIELWQFFSVLRLLWYATYVYNGHILGPVTLTPIMSSVTQWSCHCLFLRLKFVTNGIRKPNLPLAGQPLYPSAPPPLLQ